MAHPLRRRNVSAAIEKRILTALIVSTQFNQEVVHLINADYFTNSFIRTVARWCVDFYETYNLAPFDHIQDIFLDHQIELPEEDIDLINRLLTDISKRYELDSGINVDYSVAQALKFFKTRELMITSTNIKLLLEKDRIEEAEAQINNFTKVSRLTSGWVNPFDVANIKGVFNHITGMFKFPGQLGQFLGSFHRGWFVAIAAGFKTGKTWNMQEIAIAAIQQNLKVAFFSLEMYKDTSNERFYKRLSGADSTEGGISIFPCFDCLSNQNGSCKLTERTNKLPLLTRSGKPKFTLDMKYRPCTACRNNQDDDIRKKYKVAWWKEALDRPAFNETTVQIQLDALAKIHTNSYRFKNYPRFSANTADINQDLDVLEQTEGFVPDVILVDYADILKPESSGSAIEVSQLDDTWKSLSRLAGERHALVVTASQLTRAGIDKKQVKSGDMALWIGKIAHIDVFYTLNQTPEEKSDGVMRVGMMAHRYADFNENANCVILQKLSHGQACLDSQIM